jgi:hypothetical protein
LKIQTIEATDISGKKKHSAIDNGDGNILVKGNFYSRETMVLDSELYEYSTKIFRKEEGYFERLTKTTELVVYTVFSPTDYHFKMVQFQTGEETYKQVPAFVSNTMKETIDGEEYDAINCFFYGEVSYRVKPSVLYKGKKLQHFKFIGKNGHQFFFPRE